jgi:prepilin-type N-terminal cleavage/methylation domain-containing protein/prepilin-type processing-associated H-X9-DG protein
VQPRIPHLFGSSRRATGNRAFTLVELLTVIAILAILAAILFASIGAWRKSTHRAMCATNFRQAGVAILTYAADNKGKYPGPLGSQQQASGYTRDEVVSGKNKTMLYFLRPYIELITPPTNADKFVAVALVCPAWNAATGYYDVANHYTINPNTGYGASHWKVNPSVFGWTSQPTTFPGRRTTTIDNPATFWMIHDNYDASGTVIPTRDAWHGKYANELYVDGHVAPKLIPQ